MQFTKRLRDRVRRGEITCSVRVWTRPQVKVGGSYALEGGSIVVDAMERMELEDITEALAQRSGFDSVAELMKVAQHGSGSDVYLVHFHYVPSRVSGRPKSQARPERPTRRR